MLNTEAKKPLQANTPIIFGGLLMLGILATLSQGYLLFHSLAEILTVAVGFSVFILVWNSRHFLRNSAFLGLGISLFFLSIFDVVHLLAFKGMGIFPASVGANLATQLWVAGRIISGIAFFMAAIVTDHKQRTSFLFGFYSILSIVFLLSIFVWHNFPAAYVEGTGLTAFKKGVEWTVIGAYIFSLIALIDQRARLDRFVSVHMAIALLLLIGAEGSFMLYLLPNDLANTMGHVLRLAAYFFLYRAVIEAGLSRPYSLLFHDLTKSREAFKKQKERIEQYFDDAGFVLVVLDPQGVVRSANRQACHLLGYTEDQIVGKDWFVAFIPASVKKEMRCSFEKMVGGDMKLFHYYENPLLTRNGMERMIRWRFAPSRNEAGAVESLMLSGEDITEQKMVEELLHHRTQELADAKNTLERLGRKSATGNPPVMESV